MGGLLLGRGGKGGRKSGDVLRGRRGGGGGGDSGQGDGCI